LTDVLRPKESKTLADNVVKELLDTTTEHSICFTH